jgi:hypothetical protein
MKFRVFWDVAPCSHVEVDRRFRGGNCLHYHGDETSRLFVFSFCQSKQLFK